MKKLILLIALISFSPSPANALSKRSIITFSNNAEKCEKKYTGYDADFSYVMRWWDDVERVTNKNNRSHRHLKAFVELSKTYCKALKLYRKGLNEGVSSYNIEMMMIEFKGEMNRIRIDNDIYH